MEDLIAFGIGGGLFGDTGSSELSLDERMSLQTRAIDRKSGKSIKELHETRALVKDWCFGLAQIPYNKKW